MPTNLYGPGDNFDLDSSHVLPALMRKFHDSIGAADPEVVVWGNLHVNVGTGVDLSIRELAEKIRDVVNPEATLVWDCTKPDGTPRKVLDVSRLRNLGWSPRYGLDAGIRSTYDWFLAGRAADGEPRGILSAPETVNRHRRARMAHGSGCMAPLGTSHLDPDARHEVVGHHVDGSGSSEQGQVRLLRRVRSRSTVHDSTPLVR